MTNKVHDINTNSSANLQSFFARDEFQKWLSDRNINDASKIVHTMDRLSDYAIRKDITKYIFWNISEPDIFKFIYIRLAELKVVRSMKPETRSLFFFVGSLYLRFLKSKSRIVKTISEKIKSVFISHFSNGFRLNSPIELIRFRKFYIEDNGEEISLTDENLTGHITAFGTVYDGKVYIVSDDTKMKIKELADAYFLDGAQVIFFEALYADNDRWLFESGVISENMMISILRDIFSDLCFTQTYFGYTNASVSMVIEAEILRVWGDDLLLTYGQLGERLRHIPLARIKYTLGQNADFIWNSAETFSHISRINITDEEKYTIREKAANECNNRGYVSMTNLPYGEIEERNHDLTITAIHNAIYRMCLSDKFDRKGKIITHKGNTFDAFSVMKEYCRTIDKCSLDDLLDFEKELTGEVHRYIPMEAANQILVRINKKTYIADKHVYFDIEAIDAVINEAMNGDYIPLKTFTTFGAFPDCGQAWNLFLLESFCRRFSRAFRFDTSSVNSRNAGAIIRKSCDMNYTNIMTDAVAKSDIPLTSKAIGQFLYENGYTGKSTTSKAGEIINKAAIIRK